MAVSIESKARYTFAHELLSSLGGIPPNRVRLDPPPGTATIRDVIRCWKLDGRMCELVDGTLVAKPFAFTESHIAGLIITAIHRVVAKHDLGMLVGEQGMMRLMPGVVRAPDVSFVSWNQLPERLLPRATIPHLFPDMAVDVLSKGNTRREMVRKRKEYFLAGTRLVWMVNPRIRTVDVYTAPDEMITAPESGTLDGGEVLPGFKLPVRALFVNVPPTAPRLKKRL
jgi:Uma2 family endonuclease